MPLLNVVREINARLRSLCPHEGAGSFLLWLAVGLLLGLSAPGFNVWPVAWFALVPVLFSLLKISSCGLRVTKVFRLGIVLGMGFYGLYFVWFFGIHPLSWLGFTLFQSSLVAILGWAILTVYNAVVLAVVMVGTHMLFYWGRNKLAWVYSVYIIAFPLLWTGLFGVAFQTDIGLPWALLEYTQAPVSPVLQLIPLLKGWGVSCLILGCNMLLACFIWKCYSGNALGTKKYISWLSMLLIPIVLQGSTVFMEQGPIPKQEKAFPLSVAVFQGNIPIQHIRSVHDAERLAREVYINPISTMDWPEDTLLVLPEEGAVPRRVSELKPFSNRFIRELQTIASTKNLYVMAGFTSENEKYDVYNSLGLLVPEEQVLQRYHKQKLVPFGEKIPGFGVFQDSTWFDQLLAPWGIQISMNFKPGTHQELLIIGPENPVKLGGLICFELAYAELSAKYKAQGADVLVNSSNLGWFHGNRHLEEQFLAMGQIRAAETGLPLIISANTGVSALISSRGNILKKSRSRHKALLTDYNRK